MHSKKMNEAETGLAKRTASISFDRRITREEMERETDRHKLLLHQSLSSPSLFFFLLSQEREQEKDIDCQCEITTWTESWDNKKRKKKNTTLETTQLVLAAHSSLDGTSNDISSQKTRMNKKRRKEYFALSYNISSVFLSWEEGDFSLFPHHFIFQSWHRKWRQRHSSFLLLLLLFFPYEPQKHTRDGHFTTKGRRWWTSSGRNSKRKRLLKERKGKEIEQLNCLLLSIFLSPERERERDICQQNIKALDQ